MEEIIKPEKVVVRQSIWSRKGNGRLYDGTCYCIAGFALSAAGVPDDAMRNVSTPVWNHLPTMVLDALVAAWPELYVPDHWGAAGMLMSRELRELMHLNDWGYKPTAREFNQSIAATLCDLGVTEVQFVT